MNGFAEILKNSRKSSGLSQKQLGSILGISNRAISKWENGEAYPSTANLIKLTEIFNKSADSFFNKPTQRPKKQQKAESLRELYKIGCGPSSSHTIGPEKACNIFKSEHSTADSYKAILFGSLAKTGKGHATDTVIKKTFSPKNCQVEFDFLNNTPTHPNTMELYAYKDGKKIGFSKIYSVGGGRIVIEGKTQPSEVYPYDLSTFKEIADYCSKNKMRLWQYAEKCEGQCFRAYMKEIWNAMKDSIHRGLEDEGILPGTLKVHKKAKQLFNSQHIDETAETRQNRIVCAYAFAVSEQNASGEKIVTAPTCGAAGVLPAVLYYHQQKRGYNDDEIINALETAGIIGNLIKTNASISGAECGCQVEIGSACAMAAAALGELFELNIEKIEYAAEMSIEHHLGLTCDPIGGYVQIPCIERNAVAAMRAINAVNLAGFLSDTRKISFDKVVEVMRETGKDMSCSYKETSEAGLAKLKI